MPYGESDQLIVLRALGKPGTGGSGWHNLNLSNATQTSLSGSWSLYTMKGNTLPWKQN
jgi:hypothetical protein